jgi:AcrR family transcriptional regulator
MHRRPKGTPLRTVAALAPRTKRPKSRATSRSGTRYAAGRQTRGAIVRAAVDVLIDVGHARFSVQRVAVKAGISPGNLNYYFPTRESLLKMLISYTLAQYRTHVRAAAQQMPSIAVESLDDRLLWLMRDARSERTNRLFRELWAIALHDPQIAKAMDAFYSRSASAYLRRTRNQRGKNIDDAHLEAVIYLMLVISEGVSVIFGTRPNANALFERVQEAAYRAFGHLLRPTTAT